jgi:hypothetical protein
MPHLDVAECVALNYTCCEYQLTKFGLEQNPYAGPNPAVGKVLIVCPVTLVKVK